jgi:hypothetical protein
MKKKTLLYIIPHCSTGGMPQYLLKKIKLLMDDYNIYVIEWDNISTKYTVQRDRIKSILGKNFIEFLPKSKLKDSIMVIEPDIIHFEEFPEMFFYSPMEENNKIFEWIYRENRKWKIIETTHSSSFNPISKRFIPDEFVFVSSYGIDQFSSLNVPSRVIEYELDTKPRPDRTKTLTALGLDPSKKHILNVGLFTPRKNQSEIFEYAEKMITDNVMFHFVGNTAENFKDYWEPLVSKNLPNCRIWGERDNTDIFYSCMDMLLFTSRGNSNDRETNPIVIKEALSWDMPSFIYNLDVYRNMYSNNNKVTYLVDDLDENVKLIKNFLNIESIKETSKCFIISTYPDNDRRKQLTKDCLLNIKKLGYDIILTSHYPIDPDTQSICDYYIYDKYNYPTKHSYYKKFYNYTDNQRIDIDLDSLDVINQSYTVLSNYTNGVKLAKEVGYDSVICMNYDIVISELDKNVIIEMFDSVIHNDCYILKYSESNMYLYKTVIFSTKVDFYLQNIPSFNNDNEYNKWCIENDCHNFLESFFYKCLDGVGKKIILSKNESELLPNSRLNESSCVDYFVLLEGNGGRYFYLWTLNIDSREIIVYENGNMIESFNVDSNQHLTKVGDGNISISVDGSIVYLNKINGKISK